jgi:Type II secretion system (T2SS), protein E, N-terminal domain
MDMTAPDVTRKPLSEVRRGRVRQKLGVLLVKEGLIDRAQLGQALRLQQATEPHRLLGNIMVEQNFVTRPQLNSVLEKYHMEYRLGDMLVETRVISDDQLDLALVHHRKTGLRLGEALCELGFVTDRQLKRALGLQLGIPFVDLDECEIEPSLARLISESYARQHGLLAMAKTDDHITLAMDDPTNVEVVEDLRVSTSCRIDVVVAPHDATERALDRLYGTRPGASSEPADGEARGAVETDRGPSPASATSRDPAIDTIRAQADLARQLAQSLEDVVGAVAGLDRARAEHLTVCGRLDRELGELRAAHDDLRRELEATVQALTRLESVHAALLHEKESVDRSLGELRERYDALVRDQAFVADHLGAAFRRLDPETRARSGD